MHVPRRELEQKFEIVLWADNALMEMKSSGNESRDLRRPVAPSVITIRAEQGEHRPFKDSSMWRARNWSENFKESSQNSYRITYVICGSIALECAVMDLYIGTIRSIDSSALKVACSPPGIRAKI